MNYCDYDNIITGDCVDTEGDVELDDAGPEAELMAAYNIEGVIGCGGFGTVYSATRKSDGLTVNIRLSVVIFIIHPSMIIY